MYIAIYLVIYYLLLPTLPCNLLLIFCFLTLILSVKKFWTSVKIWQNYGHEFVASLFLPTLWSLQITIQCCANIPLTYSLAVMWVFPSNFKILVRPSKSVFISQYWEMTEHQAKFHKHLYDHETITFLNWRSFYHTNNRQSSQYIALTTVTQKHRTYDCPCTSN